MCGLFGFVGHRPDPVLLALAAQEAAARGPHGWGVAWANGRGLEVRRNVGALGKPVPLELLESALVVGHARMATSGDRHDVEQYQPIVVGDVALAHNGVVPAAADVAHQRGIEPPSPVDSAALAALIAADADAGGQLAWMNAVEATLNDVAPPSSTALLLLVPHKGVLSARRPGANGRPGHPLYYLERPEGTYLCSRAAVVDPPGLRWQEHPDGRVLWWPA